MEQNLHLDLLTASPEFSHIQLLPLLPSLLPFFMLTHRFPSLFFLYIDELLSKNDRKKIFKCKSDMIRPKARKEPDSVIEM